MFGQPETPRLLLAGSVSLGLCTLLLLAGGAEPGQHAFLLTPQFALWVLAVGLTVAVSSAALGVSLRDLSKLRPHARKYWPGIVASSLLFALLVLVPHVHLATRSPLAFHGLKVGAVSAFVGLTSFSAVLGLFCVDAAARSFSPEPANAARSIEDYLELRSRAERLLRIAGTVIGLATIARGLLRSALVSVKYDTTNLEREDILLYGLYLSLILAVSYYPVYASLVAAARRITSQQPMPDPASEEFGQWWQRQKQLNELLQLHGDVMGTFGKAVAVAAPLMGALFGLAFEN